MSETKLITAIDAVRSSALWRDLRDGKKKLITSDGLEIIACVSMHSPIEFKAARPAEEVEIECFPGLLLYIKEIPAAEQSESAPANVNRLKARIAALEAQLDTRPQVVIDSAGRPPTFEEQMQAADPDIQREIAAIAAEERGGDWLDNEARDV